MSCKSALYAANNNSQVLTANDVISFGSVVRRFGCNTNISGGNVVLNGSGYYDMDAGFVFTPSAAGTATITLYKDGVAIPGAEASITVTAGDTYSVTIPAIVRQTCCCETTITAVLSGVGATVVNSAIVVEKV